MGVTYVGMDARWVGVLFLSRRWGDDEVGSVAWSCGVLYIYVVFYIHVDGNVLYVCMYVCIVGGWIYSNGDIRPWKRHATYIQVQDSSHLTKINDTTSSQTHTCRHTHIHIHTRSPPSPPLLPSLPSSLLPTRTPLPLRSLTQTASPLPSPPIPRSLAATLPQRARPNPVRPRTLHPCTSIHVHM